MYHVLGIEAIVAQFIHEILIDGEVLHLVGIALLQGVDGEEEGRFGELIVMLSVAEMADGGDGEGEEDLAVGGPLVEAVDEMAPLVDDLLDGEAAACEVAGGETVTVGDHFPFPLIDPGGTPGDE